jgi:hypothetical protein
MVVIPPRRQKRRLRPIALGQFKPQHPGIETDGAVKVGHLQVDMADSGGGMDRV